LHVDNQSPLQQSGPGQETCLNLTSTDTLLDSFGKNMQILLAILDFLSLQAVAEIVFCHS
jgi:hypothetical protein